jgi:membrane protease subunit HflC
MNSGRFSIVVVIGLMFVGVGLAAFTVDETELAIKLQFGEVVAEDYEPGLYWKWPVVQNVRKFPRRILTIQDRPERVFTAENEALEVDFFVKYRIVDPKQFYISTGGLQGIADDRLSEIIKNAVVTEFGKRTVNEAISVGRAELMRDMLQTAAGTASELGVELIDFRVKQVEYISVVRDSVYQQMAAERARIAAERRATGRATAERMRAEADRARTVILASAYRDSQKIRGGGDATAAEIYANAYNKDPEFYAFYRSIDAYRKSIGMEGDLLVLDPDNDFFRYLNRADGGR